MNILFLGSNYFPYGGADSIKTSYIGRLLHLSNNKVLVLNRFGNIPKGKGDIKKHGCYNGVKYMFCTTVYRPSNFFFRSLNKLISPLIEFFVLIKFRIFEKYTVYILNTPYFHRILWYWILSRLLRVKLVYIQTELYSAHSKSPFTKRNRILVDFYSYYFVDAILPISDYLILQSQKCHFRPKYYKLSGLFDFDLMDNKNVHDDSILEVSSKVKNIKYFLFCASLGYFNQFELIIDAFSLLESDNMYLVLVGSGADYQMQEIKDKIIKSDKQSRILIFSDINYNELLYLYKHAIALLAPLENSLRDIARFPQKIAEYSASRVPIITNNTGEISNYFIDRYSAVFADNADSLSFKDAMKWVILNDSESRKIGSNARTLGLNNFDLKCHSDSLSLFLLNL